LQANSCWTETTRTEHVSRNRSVVLLV
jgi:hypothetical protein